MKTIVHNSQTVNAEIVWHTSTAKITGTAGAFAAVIMPDSGHFRASVAAPGFADYCTMFNTSSEAKVWCESKHHELIPLVPDSPSNPAIKLDLCGEALAIAYRENGMVKPVARRRIAGFSTAPALLAILGAGIGATLSGTGGAILLIASIVASRRLSPLAKITVWPVLVIALFITLATR